MKAAAVTMETEEEVMGDRHLDPESPTNPQAEAGSGRM